VWTPKQPGSITIHTTVSGTKHVDRKTHLPHYVLTQFNLCKEAITSLFWSFYSSVIEDFVFWYVTLLNLLSGSKHFKGTSGITHPKKQTSHPRKLQFSNHNKSGNISQPGVKHILMFTLNKNVSILKAYRELHYTKPCHKYIYFVSMIIIHHLFISSCNWVYQLHFSSNWKVYCLMRIHRKQFLQKKISHYHILQA
jgi:hypothetical protein